MLKESGLRLIVAETMREAAQKVIASDQVKTLPPPYPPPLEGEGVPVGRGEGWSEGLL